MNKKLILGFVIIALFIMSEVCYYGTSETIKIKVNGKERITTGSGKDISSKYVIYTDKEVFENTDDLILGKFESSDFQNKLKIDSTYQVTVVGWRVPILSMHRNVIKIN